MVSRSAIQGDLIECLPNLRAFAITLCGNTDLADDLVQETLLKGWKSLASFEEGTNLRAWLFTILRNTFLSHLRRQRGDLFVNDGDIDISRQGREPEQMAWMNNQDMLRALRKLDPAQREALILVAAEGFSYEEAARICECAVGTVKSRVNRARVRLAELLGIERPALISRDREDIRR